MNAKIATLVYVLGIIGLFRLAREPKARTSRALWIPVGWMFLAGSRTLGQWLATLGFGYTLGAAAPDQNLEGSPLDRNLFLAFTVVGIFVLANRQRKIVAMLRANGPILFFFLYCGVSVLWSDYPDVAFKRWVKLVGDLVMVLIVLTEANRLAAVKQWFSRVGFVLLPLSMLFIKYYPEWGRSYSNVFGNAVYVGVAMSKNMLGMITLIFGLSSWWCFLQALKVRHGKRRNGLLIAHGVILAVVAWLFWTADSATSLSCFMMGASLIAVTSLSRLARRPKVIFLLVAGIVSLSTFAIFSDSGGGLLGTVGRESTLTGRTDIWKLALGMAGNPIFGTGFESFWLGWRIHKVWNVFRFHLQEAHNGYLEIYLTLGWIGIILLAVLLVTGYKNVLATFRREPDLARLKLTLLVVAAVYNLTEAAFKTQNPVWIVFLLAIVGVPKALVPRHARTTDNGRIAILPELQVEHLLPAKSVQGVV